MATAVPLDLDGGLCYTCAMTVNLMKSYATYHA